MSADGQLAPEQEAVAKSLVRKLYYSLSPEGKSMLNEALRQQLTPEQAAQVDRNLNLAKAIMERGDV